MIEIFYNPSFNMQASIESDEQAEEIENGGFGLNSVAVNRVRFLPSEMKAETPIREWVAQ